MTLALFSGFGLIVWAAFLVNASVDKKTEVLRMPGIRPTYDDSYHCTWKKIEGAGFIVAFDPLVQNNSSAHHLLLYGCQRPKTTKTSVYECAQICENDDTRPRILYAWARQAPPLHMPPRVGYPIGSHSGINYLVLQVSSFHEEFIMNCTVYQGTCGRKLY